MTLDHPRFRADLEFFPVIQDYDKIIYVKDDLGLFPEDKALPAGLFKVLLLCDGERSPEQIRDAFSRHVGGADIPLEAVGKVLADFDELYLLDSPRYAAARQPVFDAYAAAPVRQAALAAKAYPEDPAELRAMLEAILAKAKPVSGEVKPLAGLVAPHIDLGAGAAMYAAAFAALAASRPETIIILGVGHKLGQGLFCLTAKDFATPLGLAKNDAATTARLAGAGGRVLAPNDFAHKNEHSIEFPLLFAQHLLPPGSFTIVPILCGSPHLALPEYSRASFRQAAGPFLEALGQSIKPDGRTLVLAGVDFCHVGPKFGHMEEAQTMERDVYLHDAALLTALTASDADDFWEKSRQVEDRYNVCGFSALAALLEILPGVPGLILGHELYREAATSSAVSFAAAAFPAP